MKIEHANLVSALAASLLLASIAPAAEKPADKNKHAISAAQAASIGPKPITIEEALQIAFQNSPTLKIALSQVESTKGSLDEAKAKFNPTFSATSTTTYQGPVASVSTGTGSMSMQSSPDTTASLSISLPLDISNQLRYSTDIARLQFESQYLALMTTSETLIADVKSAYYSLLRTQAQAEVSQASVDDAKARLAVIKAKREEGTAPQYDVTSAEVELDNLNQELIVAQNNVSLAQSALNSVLGVDVNNPTQVAKIDVLVTINSVDIVKSIELAYANRPDLKSALKSIEAKNKNIKLQQTGLMPSLSLSGGPSYDFNPSGYSTDKYSWRAAITLSLPVFDGGSTKAKVRQAKANAEASKSTLNQTKLAISSEVRQAALKVQEAALRTKTTDHAVKLAEDALSIAKDRYEAGIAVLVEVSNAQTELSKARYNRVNALYDYAVAVSNLEKAMSTQPEMKQLRLLDSSASNKDKARS